MFSIDATCSAVPCASERLADATCDAPLATFSDVAESASIAIRRALA